MAYTFDSNIVSDLHKDAHGFRPTEYFWEEWDQCGDDNRQAMWDSLINEFNNTVQQSVSPRPQHLQTSKRRSVLCANWALKQIGKPSSGSSTQRNWIVMISSTVQTQWLITLV